MKRQVFGPMQFRPYPTPPTGTFVCLAGAEDAHFRSLLLQMKSKCCLLSFYHLRRQLSRGKDSLQRLKDELLQFDYVYMDSGGYTLQQIVKRGKLAGENLKSYINDYYDMAEELRDYVHVFGAVDCIAPEQGFSYDDMDKYVYQAYERGIHIAPTVFAGERRQDVIDSGYLHKFDIVGIGSSTKTNLHLKSMVSMLKKTGIKIHGYAMTKQDEFRYYPFFSVDSLTWFGGQKFGSTYVFKNGRMRTYGLQYKERIRRELHHVIKEHGINEELIAKDKFIPGKPISLNQEIYDEIHKLNLVAWVDLAAFYRKSLRRAYWNQQARVLMDEEGNRIAEAAPISTELQAMDTPEGESQPVYQAVASVPREVGDVLGNAGQPIHRVLPLRCNDCFMADKGCPKYKVNSDCSISFTELFQISARKDAIQESAYHILELQFERIQRAALFEKGAEGTLDHNLSHEISRYFGMLKDLKYLSETTSSIRITATGAAATGAASGGGILSQLLKG